MFPHMQSENMTTIMKVKLLLLLTIWLILNYECTSEALEQMKWLLKLFSVLAFISLWLLLIKSCPTST